MVCFYLSFFITCWYQLSKALHVWAFQGIDNENNLSEIVSEFTLHAEPSRWWNAIFVVVQHNCFSLLNYLFLLKAILGVK